jgi:hypothetical protein
VAAATILSSCNPFTTPAIRVSGLLWGTMASFDGPAETWIQVRVHGADGLDVLVSAFVPVDPGAPLGPVDRWCDNASRGVHPCTILSTLVANEGLSPASPTTAARLITVWPGERVSIGAFCLQAGVGLVDCPASMRLELTAVDWNGHLAGQLG